jgi:4'-phosphopantetheinyl transferase
MLTISSTNCIKCFFKPDTKRSSDFSKGLVEVYYGFTGQPGLNYSDLENYISRDEKLRAERFLFDEDRYTYISCHGLLRAVLSEKLGKQPLEIAYTYDSNNKPGLEGNPYYFNITHDRGAFALVVSKYFYAGIDIERADRSIDFIPIIKTNFSKKESKFILKMQSDAQENFILLWTRKEALLKAIGTGIVSDLTKIEVSESENIIYKESFDNIIEGSVYNEHFIYSIKLSNYYLSITIPQQEEIKLFHINGENINSYLTRGTMRHFIPGVL